MFAKKIPGPIVMAVLMMVGAAAVAGAWPDLPPAKAFISGPGIEGELAITDAKVLDVLRLGGIEDIGSGTIQKPEAVGNGFKIVRYFDGGEFHYGDLIYYPNAAGARSVVYFDDALNGQDGPSPLHKRWLYATANGDKVLQSYLKSIGLKLPSTGSEKSNVVTSAKVDALAETIMVGQAQPKAVEAVKEPAVVETPETVKSPGNEPLTLALAPVAGIVGVAGMVGVMTMRRRAGG